jgi:hypothetical protein
MLFKMNIVHLSMKNLLEFVDLQNAVEGNLVHANHLELCPALSSFILFDLLTLWGSGLE